MDISNPANWSVHHRQVIWKCRPRKRDRKKLWNVFFLKKLDTCKFLNRKISFTFSELCRKCRTSSRRCRCSSSSSSSSWRRWPTSERPRMWRTIVTDAEKVTYGWCRTSSSFSSSSQLAFATLKKGISRLCPELINQIIAEHWSTPTQ